MISTFIDFFSLTSTDYWARVLLSILCGSIIGIERQLRGKPVGLRTCILVCFATQAFVNLGSNLDGPVADPTRVLGQVVTGIGFLGAGTILTHKRGISGITTAAVVWVLAAIGCYLGLGFYREGVFLAFSTLAVLLVARKVEGLFKDLAAGSDDRSD